MESHQANRLDWTCEGLDDALTDGLRESLVEAIVESGADRGWLLEFHGGTRVELLSAHGKSAPVRTRWRVESLPTAGRLDTDELSSLSPYDESQIPANQGRLTLTESGGLLVVSGAKELTEPSSSKNLDLHLRLLQSRRETATLRRRVQRLSEEQKRNRQVSMRLEPVLKEGERRAEALVNWHRQTSQMLAGTHLSARLPDLVQHARKLLDVDLAAVLMREGERVRIWGTGPWQESASHRIEELGALGEKVIGNSETLRYQKSRVSNDPFLDEHGVMSALALPLCVDERNLGAMLFACRKTHRFTTDEINLAYLTAHQSALLLENMFLVAGADVERVVAKAVLESMADGVVTMDWQKKIISFNSAAEEITGWRAEDAIGRTCAEVMNARYHCAGGEPLGTCAENCPLLIMLADQELMERGLTVEGYAVHKSGEPRYYSSTYSVIADRGDLLGAVVLFRDITAKKRLEEMKSDYAAALSHDLKTPLTAMKGYAVTLIKHGERLDSQARKEALEVINFEIDRVSRMFDNLLHQARLEAGVKNTHIVSVSPAVVIGQLIKLYAYSGRTHELIADVDRVVVLKTDRDQLDQILNNLVSNALKYTPDGSRVTIRCKYTDDEQAVRFEVIDNGPGIAAEDVPFIFERFHRLGGTRSKQVRGTGLGLHITRMLVESLGGEAGVESIEGEGSRFWFVLPTLPESSEMKE